MPCYVCALSSQGLPVPTSFFTATTVSQSPNFPQHQKRKLTLSPRPTAPSAPLSSPQPSTHAQPAPAQPSQKLAPGKPCPPSPPKAPSPTPPTLPTQPTSRAPAVLLNPPLPLSAALCRPRRATTISLRLRQLPVILLSIRLPRA